MNTKNVLKVVKASFTNGEAGFIVILKGYKGAGDRKHTVIRTMPQMVADLKGSQLIGDSATDADVLKVLRDLRNSTVTGNIVFGAAGSTYTADENSRVVTEGCAEGTKFIGKDKKEAIAKAGQKLPIGTLVFRTGDGNRVTEGFLDFEVNGTVALQQRVAEEMASRMATAVGIGGDSIVDTEVDVDAELENVEV